MAEGLQLITYSQALKQGTDLWVISDAQNSSWPSKIDWYLCFQMKKNKLNCFEASVSQIQSLIKKYKLSSFQWKAPQPLPVLIESSSHLPNLWTLKLTYSEEWINRIYDIWCSLNQPKLRIFVPQPIKKEKIIEKWEEHAKNNLIQYIME